MGLCLGDLEPRQVERLRVELSAVLAARFSAPPFFDYQQRRILMRPITRAQHEDSVRFLSSVNFAQYAAVETASPELRRVFERLIVRYLDLNETLRRPRYVRWQPLLRSRVAAAASGVQRSLLAHLAGTEAAFGTRREPYSWSQDAALLDERLLRDEGRVLLIAAAALGASAPAMASTSLLSGDAPHVRSSGTLATHLPERMVGQSGAVTTDATVPVAAQALAVGARRSPFRGLETGAQSAIFGAAHPSELETSPLQSILAPSPPHLREPATPNDVGLRTESDARALPPDLFALYGDYLRDAASTAVAPVAVPATNGHVPHSEVPAPTSPSDAPVTAATPTATAASPTRGDLMIFQHLRFQIEAYVRRAARSYGLADQQAADPVLVFDRLRQSGLVDDADLQIAETLLALCDTVTATGSASLDDYRQALTLYLLYHRSHLGA